MANDERVNSRTSAFLVDGGLFDSSDASYNQAARHFEEDEALARKRKDDAELETFRRAASVRAEDTVPAVRRQVKRDKSPQPVAMLLKRRRVAAKAAPGNELAFSGALPSLCSAYDEDDDEGSGDEGGKGSGDKTEGGGGEEKVDGDCAPSPSAAHWKGSEVSHRSTGLSGSEDADAT